MPDIDAFFAVTVATVPLRDAIIEICAATTKDTTLQQVLCLCQAAWPNFKNLSPDILQLVHSHDNFTECDCHVMYDARIVILFALRDKMLQALYDAHQGIVKMRERARTSLWRQKLGDDIERIASLCVTCAHRRTLHVEPLLPSPLPDVPWQKVATDLFEYDGSITSLSWITFHAA